MIINADCIEAMREMDADSIDAIVCDPPYGLEFMGKEWDRLGDVGQTSHQGFDDEPGFKGFRLASYSGSSNRKCAKCRKWEWDYPKRKCVCDRPDFPNIRAHQARLMQEWHHAWATEALRVLKPGAHLLAFGGTRTYHRLACAVEDAGFEIRDSLIWLYGSGFPKSLDVSKAIDRQRDDYEARCAVAVWLRPHVERHGFAEVSAAFGFQDQTMVRARWTTRSQPNTPTLDQWAQLKTLLDLPDDMDAEVWRLNGRKGQPGENWEKREKIGEKDAGLHRGSGTTVAFGEGTDRSLVDITAPATPEAQRWQGWGTALKPAHEPIVVARKPLTGTVAQTVLEYGTGALNVDGCRVGTDEAAYYVTNDEKRTATKPDGVYGFRDYEEMVKRGGGHDAGRWPANALFSHLPGCERVGTRRVKGSDRPNREGGDYESLGGFLGERAYMHSAARHADPDGTEQVEAWRCEDGCPVAELDRQSGETGGGFGVRGQREVGVGWASRDGDRNSWRGTGEVVGYGDTGGASRFYYVAKASRAERNAGLGGFEERGGGCLEGNADSVNARKIGARPEQPVATTRNAHPTVKPLDLMRWLCRLVVPPGGTCLDPFAGSGTTGAACMLEGFDFIGIEREAEYAAIAEARVKFWAQFPGADVDAVLASDAKAREIEASGQMGLL